MKKGFLLVFMLLAGFLVTGRASGAMKHDDFMELCRTGTPRVVEAAIADGYDPNSGKDVSVPEIVSLLPENGADTQLAGNEGETAPGYVADNLKDTDVYRQLAEPNPAAVKKTEGRGDSGQLRPGRKIACSAA